MKWVENTKTKQQYNNNKKQWASEQRRKNKKKNECMVGMMGRLWGMKEIMVGKRASVSIKKSAREKKNCFFFNRFRPSRTHSFIHWYMFWWWCLLRDAAAADDDADVSSVLIKGIELSSLSNSFPLYIIIIIYHKSKFSLLVFW